MVNQPVASNSLPVPPSHSIFTNSHYTVTIDTVFWSSSGFPLRLENLKKMGRHFPVREFWTDWKSQGKSHYILENSENFKCYFLFLVIFIWTVYYFQKWIRFSVKENKTLKKYWKMEKKYWKSRGTLSGRKRGKHANASWVMVTCRPPPHPTPTSKQNNRHLWKHYHPATSLGGNKTSVYILYSSSLLCTHCFGPPY